MRKNPQRTGRRVMAIITTLLLWAGWAQAARAAEAATEQPRPDEAGTAEQRGDRPSRDDSPPEIFVPTEEISEDFAVSFPVDI